MIQFRGENKELGGLPFMMELKDGPDNVLEIVIAAETEGESGHVPDWVDSPEMRRLIEPLPQLLPSKELQYAITFEGYIMYTVRDESYSQYHPGEMAQGRILKVFEKSKLLDYVTEVTCAQQLVDGTYFPGPWKHYAILTQNHTIDVIAADEPVIRIKKE